MSDDRRKRLGQALMEALELDEEAQRAYVAELRAEAPDLADELESMLSVDTMGTDFLAGSAAEEVGAPEPSWREPLETGIDVTGDERWVGPYRLMHVLGTGGMGEVFLAEQREPLQRKVALKLIRGRFRSDVAKARFEAERQLLQRLEHPNVARILDAGTHDGSPFFALEVIEGERLDRYCDQNNLSIRERLRLMVAVCRGVQHAHQKRIIHRDLKPSNVLVSEIDGAAVPKIIDFGIGESLDRPAGKPTGDAMAYGTPSYMSPEALRGSLDIDTRTDVYSLGVVLYQLLVGCRPFDVGSVEELVAKVSTEDPPSPSTRLSSSLDKETATRIAEERQSSRLELRRALAGDLRWILLKALAKEVEQRYESAAALADDLENHLEHRPVSARPSSPGYRARKWIWRHRWPVAAAALITIAGLGLLAQGLYSRARTERLTRAGQELTRQIERVEWRLRVVDLMPRRDLTPELDSIRRGMRDLRSKIPDLYAGNRAMAEYALGRAALSLDELDQAKKHLDAAWQDGYQRPEAALALGTTLSRLYERELDSISRVRNAAARQSLRRQAEKNLRAPALEMLSRAQGDLAIPELLQARMAAYREDFEEALEQSRAVSSETSSYEAKFLEAQILQRQAAVPGQEREQVLAKLAEAEQAAIDGLEIARSSLVGHLRLCRIRSARVSFLSRYSLPGTEEAAGLAFEACDAAESVLPSWPDAALESAGALLNLAEVEVWDRHSDPTTIANRLEATLAQIRAGEIGSANDRAEAEWTVGLMTLLRSVYFEQQGVDPRQAFDQMIGEFRRALELAGGSHPVHRELAAALAKRGNYEMNRGGDPTADLDEAEFHAKAAAELSPEAAEPWGYLAAVHIRRAEQQLKTGKNPVAQLDAADAAIERSRAIDSKRVAALSAAAVANMLRGRWLRKTGGAAAASFRRTIDVTKETLELFPDSAYSLLTSGQSHMELARLEWLAGRDPLPLAAKSRRLFAQGLEKAPGLPGPLVDLAELALIEARYGMTRGQSPIELVQEAIRQAARALEIDDRRHDAVRAQGEAELLAAVWTARQGGRLTGAAERRAVEAFDRARGLLERSLEGDRRAVETHLAIARLAWRQGQLGLAGPDRAVSDGGGRAEALVAGFVAAREAQRLDPFEMEAVALEGALLSLEPGTVSLGLNQVAGAVERNPNLAREWHDMPRP